MPDSQPDGFFTGITASEAGQLLGLASNSVQVGTFLYAIVSGLLEESDTDKIIDAINQLEQTISADFAQLGQLIQEQIQMVVQNENAIALADALAHTATASDKLQRYLRTKDQPDLDDADTESDLGIQFFLALPSTSAGTGASQTDPFFLPGIAKAATIRTMVIVTQDKNFLSAPNDVDQINNMIGLLQGMIDFVKATVNAAHTVQIQGHEIGKPQGTNITLSYDGYWHEERGRQLQFFSSGGARDFDDPRVTKARNEAEQARQAGVDGELAYMGIPGFETLVGQWQQLLIPQFRRAPVIGRLPEAGLRATSGR
jgi:hypothetical protein